MKSVAILLTLLASQAAFAAGGFHCIADDATLKVELGAVVTHGMGSPIVDASGTLEYKDTDGQPKLNLFTFEKSDIHQYWNFGEAFNLVVYQEDYNSKDSYDVMLVVQTTTKDDGETFTGTYRTVTGQNVGGVTARHTAEGQITCTVE